jgi:hypothetical protein
MRAFVARSKPNRRTAAQSEDRKRGPMFKRMLLMVLFVFALEFVAGPMPVALADGPVANAAYLNNQMRTIGPGSQWFYFDRGSDPVAATVTLVNGVSLGLAFNVYAPNKNDAPIGRGTVSNVVCNSNGDKCPSVDLTWTGGANSPGRYSVEVVNNSQSSITYLLTLGGGSATPAPSYVYPPYYVPPYYVAPSVPSYVPPYYMPPIVAPYVPPYYVSPYVPYYVPPYYVPGYVQPYRP